MKKKWGNLPEEKRKTLQEKLEEKNIEFIALTPFMDNRGNMCIRCPIDNAKILLSVCKRCKNWLGVTRGRKDYWLCSLTKKNNVV